MILFYHIFKHSKTWGKFFRKNNHNKALDMATSKLFCKVHLFNEAPVIFPIEWVLLTVTVAQDKGQGKKGLK